MGSAKKKYNRNSFRNFVFSKNENIAVGKRYVFFQSLGTSQSQSGVTLPIYYVLRSIGQGFVGQAAAILGSANKQSINQTQINNLKTYIEVIGQAAQNQLSNESNFVKRILEQTKDTELKEFIQTKKNLIDPSSEDFDYEFFMTLLNEEVLKYNELMKQRKNILLQDMRFVTSKLQNLKNSGQENIVQEIQRTFYEQEYKIYGQILTKYDVLKKMSDDKKFLGDPDQFLTTRLTRIMSMIGKNFDKYQGIIQKGFQQQGLSFNLDSLKAPLAALLMQYLTEDGTFEQLRNKTAAQLRDSFFTELQRQKRFEISQSFIRDIENTYREKQLRALEQAALISGRGVTDIFLTLDKSTQESVIAKYKLQSDKTIRPILDKLRQKASDLSAAQKNKLTKKINQAILNAANTSRKELQKLELKTRKELVEQLRALNPDFFTPKNFQKTIENQLNINVNAGSIEEILIAQALRQITAALNDGSINATVHGVTGNNKTDISISYDGGKLEGIPSAAKTQIASIFDNIGANYQKAYNERTFDTHTVDVNASSDAYLDAWREAQGQISQILNNDEGLIKDTLTNFITGQITVKEYIKSGDLGFKGGSLGEGGAPQAVINNINAMYKLGGITPADAETLYFAAVNCGPDGLGNGLKQPLETYLLGGAALMMFDDGFTATNNYLQTMEKELGFSKAGLHLYSVNGTIVPASYVYSSIYNNLCGAYGELVGEMGGTIASSQAISQNKVTITNNITEEKDKPSWREVHSAQARWQAVKDTAAGSVNISFTFLGGMLDMFERIAKGFNI